MESAVTLGEKAKIVMKRYEGQDTSLEVITIASNIDYVKAHKNLDELKQGIKELEEERKSLTVPLDDIKKRYMDIYRKPIAFLEDLKVRVNQALIAYDEAQERKRREEQARIEEKARKEAEDLRLRAERAAAKGKTEKAEELNQRAEEKIVATPVVPTFTPKIPDTGIRVNWKYRIVNPDLVPREYCKPDDVVIGAEVRSRKGQVKIPGIEVYSEKKFV